MSPDVFRDAKLLYEAAARSGLAPDPHAVAEKMKQLAAGMPSEDEFACLAAWSGRCRLIHKLDQDQFPPASRDDYQVPDFFAVFQGSGEPLSVLVEVKKTSPDVDKKLFNTRQTFSEAYYRRLTNYTAAVGLPLLIAWKTDPIGWTLFDIRRTTLAQTARHINLDEAIKENLLGVIMGDFSYSIAEQSAFVMDIERLSPTVDDHFEARVSDVYYTEPAGGRVEPIAEPFFHMFTFMDSEQEAIEEDSRIIQRFFVPVTQGSWAHWLLFPAAHGIVADDVNWRAALLKGEFPYTLADALVAAQDAGRKGLVERIIHMVPHTIPDFLGDDLETLKRRGFGWPD